MIVQLREMGVVAEMNQSIADLPLGMSSIRDSLTAIRQEIEALSRM